MGKSQKYLCGSKATGTFTNKVTEQGSKDHPQEGYDHHFQEWALQTDCLCLHLSFQCFLGVWPLTPRPQSPDLSIEGVSIAWLCMLRSTITILEEWVPVQTCGKEDRQDSGAQGYCGLKYYWMLLAKWLIWRKQNYNNKTNKTCICIQWQRIESNFLLWQARFPSWELFRLPLTFLLSPLIGPFFKA